MKLKTSKNFFKNKKIFIECNSAEKNIHHRKTNYPKLKSISKDLRFFLEKERYLSHKKPYNNFNDHDEDDDEVEEFIEFIPKKIKFNLIPINSNFKKHSKHKKEIIVAKTREDSSRNEQALIRNSNLIPLPPSIVSVSKSICIIFTQFSSASGFLLKLFKGEENFFCLVTNEYVINENLIRQGARIEFKYDG